MLTGKPDGRTLPSGQGFPTLHGLSRFPIFPIYPVYLIIKFVLCIHVYLITNAFIDGGGEGAEIDTPPAAI